MWGCGEQLGLAKVDHVMTQGTYGTETLEPLIALRRVVIPSLVAMEIAVGSTSESIRSIIAIHELKFVALRAIRVDALCCSTLSRFIYCGLSANMPFCLPLGMKNPRSV